MKNKRGFSLVELIAVIIILGIVMLIAVPNIGRSIEDSRKKAYVEIANRYVDIVRTKVAAGEIKIDDPNTTYYISYETLRTEHGSESPWGKWISAYVVAIYNPDLRKVEYYWTSLDSTGHKIILKSIEDITIDDIIIDRTMIETDRRRVGVRDSIITINADGTTTESRPVVSYTKVEADRCFYYYENGDGTITIDGYIPDCGLDVIVPSKIDGKVVSTIGTYAFSNLGIKTVILSEGIVTVEYAAFRSNVITEVEYPTTLRTIGAWAFANNRLTEIALRSSCTIGGGAYTGNLFDDSTAFIYAQGDYSRIIGYAGSPTTSLVIPPVKNGVQLKTIGESAFRGLGLASVTIPETVTKIESSAFQGNALTSITFPQGLLTIGAYSFANNQLTSISFPSSVTSIGTRSFNANQVPLGGQGEFVYARTASGPDYSKIVSYAGVTKDVSILGTKNGVTLKTIDSNSFMGCSLSSVTIPSSVTSIGTKAFSANQITNDTAWIYARNADGSVNYSKLIGYGGKNRGTASNPLVIPGKKNGVELKTIGNSCFSEDGLKGVVIPESVTSIETNAFRYCYLPEVTIPKNVISIGSNAFAKEVAWNRFNLYSKIINKTGRSFNWKSITNSAYDNESFPTGTIHHHMGDIQVVAN